MEENDRELSRVEAAAYLTTKGRDTKPSTLAKFATMGTGPPFTKEAERSAAIYKQSDLDTWLQSNMSRSAGGRPKKKEGMQDLISAIGEFLPVAERAALGQGTFADGVQFQSMLQLVKKHMQALVRHKRANGTD